MPANPFQINQQETGDHEMTDMSRATYVKAPADKPMGLDLKQFE